MRQFRFFYSASIAILIAGLPSFAYAENPKLKVDGDRLIYDTENIEDRESADIETSDVEDLRALLSANPAITTLVLNSGGGSVWAASNIKDVVIDHELDTHVDGDCDSSCVTVFLAGVKRTMSRGSRIGFHQYFWNTGSIERYYERNKDSEGWDTPFDFASWIYNDTQSEVYENLSYMISRGVDASFAVQTLRLPDGDMWRPYRPVLLAAGVLTE